jgi:N-methylhydantoinase B
MAPGDVVSVQTPGGGGAESALERDPARVAADVAQGKISAERARAVYGVVVDAATGALDAAATAAARREATR